MHRIQGRVSCKLTERVGFEDFYDDLFLLIEKN
ncbi:MAG: hypothetical protein JWQ34_3736 [Mucilaginibacter sp.]|nr:hypothetical protein [Mucilaginibacter sp.]